MITEFLNGVKTYAPSSRKELMDYAMSHKKILIAVNAEKILHATDESRNLINRNLGYPDGIGAVWALQKKGHPNVVKIPGCELWLDLVQSFYKEKSFYLVGGKQEIIERTVNTLKKDFSGMNICNYRNGYIKVEEEELALIEDIVKHKPDIVLVAMGSPKQELLMERIQNSHEATYQGLGGSFDVYTGNVKRAPEWWVKNNLEWAYRLVKQPSRIKRQIHLVKFFVNLHLGKY
ncbi:WecB/TagA/CpsF family glycosyltransferase [Bizionia arctica]|uniref:UDP-N-acetyl-D-mannosaminuronic acid transferase n=1 Tax=Bizionia arctica TaxID=1495645 RepID=A0A917GXR8_9FLAO|nr:WecB/TagA/CpsF family glycosyltransferase [Bizionia arctica]GGG60197.1 UDP-N-acetyl-D-mannosaminuronic acid transferase [Bizionia arctica]